MIKVLHVVDKLSVGDSTIHGVTRLFSWWIPRFDKSRYDVSVCSLRKRDRAGEYLEKIGIKVFYLNKGKFDPFTLSSLIRIVRNERVDILHLHGYGAATFGRLCSIFKDIPCLVHEHMYDVNIPSYQRVADFMLSRFAAQAIAVSESVKDFIVRYRSVPSEKVKVIYNGVPLEAFDSSLSSIKSTREQTWKKKLSIPLSHKLIGIVGRLHLIKGHHYFLDAAKEVLREFKDVTFLVVGDGELMNSLKEQSKHLGIDEHVIFTGYCEDVPSLLSEIDINVIASLSEGVPLTLFEAMAAGCAIVSTNVGGLGEVIEDNETGFLVPSKDPKALAEKILLLLKDPELHSVMARRAQQTSKQFDICYTVRQMEQCYEEIIA